MRHHQTTSYNVDDIEIHSGRQACGYNADKMAWSLEEERAGEEQKGGEKLNRAEAQRAAAIPRLLLLQKALRVDHILFHAAPRLHLINQGGVADLLDADGVVIPVAFAAALILQEVGAIHASIHELLVGLCPWRGLVDVITAIVPLISGLAAIMAVHVVVVVVFLRGAAEAKMGPRETSQSISNGHPSYSPHAGCHHGFFGKTWRFGLVSHGLYRMRERGP